MKSAPHALWTIDELSERVAGSLEESDYGGVLSGRVRDLPDLRTIRYYTTLGLLDRPAAMRGRTALYGTRHLLQLVAIKRLQARGLSLAEVQERVVGLSNTALRRLNSAAAVVRSGTQAPPAASPSRADSFWRIQPSMNENEAGEESPGEAHLRLEHGVTLSLTAQRAVTGDDLRVIHMAAAPLIEILKLRGLIGIGLTQPKRGDVR
jgi:DNA-binding transcriptional MerR regulator